MFSRVDNFNACIHNECIENIYVAGVAGSSNVQIKLVILSLNNKQTFHLYQIMTTL